LIDPPCLTTALTSGDIPDMPPVSTKDRSARSVASRVMLSNAEAPTA